MKKRSLKFLSEGIGYSTAVFFLETDAGEVCPKLDDSGRLVRRID